MVGLGRETETPSSGCGSREVLAGAVKVVHALIGGFSVVIVSSSSSGFTVSSVRACFGGLEPEL